MSTAAQKQQSLVPNAPASIRNAPSIKHQPRSQRYYFDVGLGAVCLSQGYGRSLLSAGRESRACDGGAPSHAYA